MGPLLLLTLFSLVHADYDCLCNYNVEKSIYAAPSETGQQPIGYLYEFDCKATVQSQTATNGWTAIAFEHQVGYVLTDGQTSMQICSGDPPNTDTVTTKQPTTSTTTTPKPTTTTTTPKPTTTTTTPQPTTTTTTPQPTTTTTTPKPTTITTTPQPTTTMPKPTTITTTPQPTTTTPKPTTTTTTPQPTTTTTTPQPTTTTPKPTTTTTTPQPTTTTTHKPTTPTTTTQPTTTTPKPTTATAKPSSSTVPHGPLSCPDNVLQSTRTDGGTAFVDTTEGKCFEFVPSKHTWAYSESICLQNGGHLASISSITQNELLHSYVQTHGHPTWIGLSDRDREEHFVWSSGEQLTYKNWHTGRKDILFHGMEDCVAMGPLTGTWEDVDCTIFYAYICEYAAVTGHGSLIQTTTPPPSTSYNTDGNINLCPPLVIQHSRLNGHSVGQYGKSCYEIIKSNKVTWTHGEDICNRNGGHLAYITTSKEQAFMQAFMKRHYGNHAVWIGLHDLNTEGHFEWSSGKAVTYTNWLPGHTDNFFSHNREDCVLFIPYENGIWDDIPCGQTSFFFGDSGETYAPMCQYEISTYPSSILVG